MNIFYFTTNQKINAKLLDDKRLVKMVLETTQLLSNGLFLNTNDSPYKPSHLKHPCSIWAGNSQANWNWLKIYGLELSKEYTRRYSKIHKCENIIKSMNCPNISNEKFENPPQCMPDKYKCNKSTEAYIKYYIGEKFNKDYFKHSCNRVISFWEDKINKSYLKNTFKETALEAL